jgi:large subunit ribosomal protein L33
MKRKVILICSVCQNRNYAIFKSGTGTTRMELNKYCPTCKTHTLHKETK